MCQNMRMLPVFFDVGIDKKRGSKFIFCHKHPFGHGGKTQQQTATGYDFFHGFEVLSWQNSKVTLKNTLVVTVSSKFQKIFPLHPQKLRFGSSFYVPYRQ